MFRTKLNFDGTVNKLKAKLVVQGYNQQFGVDFSEILALVTRLDIIKLFIALAAQKNKIVYQLDVKSDF
uniref:Reverse transcriptase Ty1/copia-type domain-containing protein n=1 Tax=Rhizophora mucronata TaxID=61149 RepID=A0A2P2JVL8_RHIMU